MIRALGLPGPRGNDTDAFAETFAAPLDLPPWGKVYRDRVMGGLKIGELALRAGVTPKAIRFYERKGILPPPRRAANGYRVYGEEAVDRLRFVKQAAGLGLTLAEIREILAIREGGRPPCAHVHQLLRAKAAELDRKLADLLSLRARIRRSLAAWKRARPTRAAVCPHIERGPQRVSGADAAGAAGRPPTGRGTPRRAR